MTDTRVLVMSTDHARVRRIASFLAHFPVKVLRARSPESALQFFSTVSIDVAIADDTCPELFGALKRYHPEATCLHIAHRASDRHPLAKTNLLAPVDLFVLESALRDTLAFEKHDELSELVPVAAE